MPFLGEYYFLDDKLNWCSPRWPEIGISDSGFPGANLGTSMFSPIYEQFYFKGNKVCFFSLNVLKIPRQQFAKILMLYSL